MNVPQLDPDPPHDVALFALFMIITGIAGTCTGQIWARNGKAVYRAKNPKTYWLGVVTYFAAGVGLFVFYLYKAGMFTN